jgi:hypothetical protein
MGIVNAGSEGMQRGKRKWYQLLEAAEIGSSCWREKD